uniref:Uncharacterized protein n=1 Tax=Anguilla anguilla TaxID=7936 RepID=A0A0E9XJ70_ANGAN
MWLKRFVVSVTEDGGVCISLVFIFHTKTLSGSGLFFSILNFPHYCQFKEVKLFSRCKCLVCCVYMFVFFCCTKSMCCILSLPIV